MRIEITRRVRLTVWGSELQALNPGEIYDVAPAIGRVLVGEGWAMELATERRELWNDPGGAEDERPGPMSAS